MESPQPNPFPIPTVSRALDVPTYVRESGHVSDALQARIEAERPDASEIKTHTEITRLLAAITEVKREIIIARQRLKEGFISNADLKARVLNAENIIADTLRIVAQSGKIDAPEVSLLHAYCPAGMLIQDKPSDEKEGFDTTQDTVVLQGICDGLFGTLEAAQRYLRTYNNLPSSSVRLAA